MNLPMQRRLTMLNNELLNLSEAADEVMLLDDEAAASIPMQIGSIFVHYDQVSWLFLSLKLH
jgi:hypothetical protein